MKKISFIHTADLHLGLPLQKWLDSAELTLLRKKDYLATFFRILNVVKEKKVPFFFIAGDFLEHGFVQSETVFLVKEELGKLPCNVFIAPGNHDPYRDDSFYCSKWPRNVHIFKGAWENIYFKDYDLTILGKGFTDFLECNSSLPQKPKSSNVILIAHATFLQTKVASKCLYFPLYKEDLLFLKPNYVALGHIHKPSMFKLEDKLKNKIIVCYPGSPEGLCWKELGKRYIVHGVLENGLLTLNNIEIHTRTLEKVSCDISALYSFKDILEVLLKELANFDKESFFEICFLGRRQETLDMFLLKDFLVQNLKHSYPFFKIQDATYPDFDLDFYRKDIGVIGKFINRFDKLLEEKPAEKELIQAALYKGLEALLWNRKN